MDEDIENLPAQDQPVQAQGGNAGGGNNPPAGGSGVGRQPAAPVINRHGLNMWSEEDLINAPIFKPRELVDGTRADTYRVPLFNVEINQDSMDASKFAIGLNAGFTPIVLIA